MKTEDRLVRHFADRLGCDTEAFRQKRALVIASPARDAPEAAGQKAPLWLFHRKRALILSVVPPLAGTIRNHYADSLREVEEVAPETAHSMARDLAPFYGEIAPVLRTWYFAEPGFGHVPQIEIRPLDSRDAKDVEAFAPGRWSEISRWASIGRAEGISIDRRIVGWVILAGVGDDALEIDCATHPEFRGIGIGRELIAHACQKALAADRIPALAAPHESPPAGHIAKRLGLSVFAHDILLVCRS